MSTRRKTLRSARTRNFEYSMPLCPDCQMAMDFVGDGPLIVSGTQVHFELVCPNCKKTLSESLMNRKAQRRADVSESTAEKLTRILDVVDRLPDLDDRSYDEILGYDENGVPH
jgi:predicted amidophosphoribosyltransferase